MHTDRNHARPIKWSLGILVAGGAVAVLVGVLGSSGLVPGGSPACESAAQSLSTFAGVHHTYRATGTKDRQMFWNLHTALLADCPLSGVTYFSTHTMSAYLAR